MKINIKQFHTTARLVLGDGELVQRTQAVAHSKLGIHHEHGEFRFARLCGMRGYRAGKKSDKYSTHTNTGKWKS